jgi:L-fucose mutarotase
MIHPELLDALGRAGHGSKILITDGNYPHQTGAPAAARRIYLNLAPGLLDVGQILDVLKQAVPIEQAGIMVPAPDAPPELRPDKIEAHDEYKAALPDVEFVEISRWDFYDEAKKDDVGIVIASGEQRIYANLLLTIGVRQ